MSGSITTDDLATRIDDAARAPYILDVRSSDAYDRWRIEGKVPLDISNIPYWTVLGEMESVVGRLPKHREVVVVCAHGGSSGMVVETIDQKNVHNLQGGMDAWANTLVPRTLWDNGSSFVVQFDRVAKGCLSYAVGSRGASIAVIDAGASLEPYLALAEEMNATITDAFDTHLHADHVSLGRQVAAHTGATYRIAAGDAETARFEFAPLVDGERFEYGDLDVVVRSVATPGHTPGSTSLEVGGRFLMTGDAVFVSGIGRPDLGGQTEAWAMDLFSTIHDTLSGLDHGLEVCPAHYTSRSESRDDGTLRRGLGDLLQNDPIVSMTDAAAFVAYVVEHLGTAPNQYDDIRKVNLGHLQPDPEMLKELEVGRNECALSS